MGGGIHSGRVVAPFGLRKARETSTSRTRRPGEAALHASCGTATMMIGAPTLHRRHHSGLAHLLQTGGVTTCLSPSRNQNNGAMTILVTRMANPKRSMEESIRPSRRRKEAAMTTKKMTQ